MKPPKDSPEIQYLLKTRNKLGGPIPRRRGHTQKLAKPSDSIFQKFTQGFEDKEISSTMAFVRMMTDILKDKNVGEKSCLLYLMRRELLAWKDSLGK